MTNPRRSFTGLYNLAMSLAQNGGSLKPGKEETGAALGDAGHEDYDLWRPCRSSTPVEIRWPRVNDRPVWDVILAPWVILR